MATIFRGRALSANLLELVIILYFLVIVAHIFDNMGYLVYSQVVFDNHLIFSGGNCAIFRKQ